MQSNWETAAANYAAQQQAMGFPNMGQGGMGNPYMGQDDAEAWEQWQQEYALWQAQYGEQYEQAMQGMQMMSNQSDLQLGVPPPPPPSEDSSNFRGRGRGGRGGFRGGQRGQGGAKQWEGGNQQSNRGGNQQFQNRNQQQNWGNNQQQNNWGGNQNQQRWGGNQNQQNQQWNQNQNQQSDWVGGQQQNFGGMRGRGRGGRGRGVPPSRGNFNNNQGGQFQGPGAPASQTSNIPPLMPPKVAPGQGIDFNKPQPPPPPPSEQPKPLIPASQPPAAQSTPSKDHTEELSQAEKEFDEQFKNWEGQFNTWKEQNKFHPDRQQYEEYETKMEKFREQLLSRREQMRKKREMENKAKAGNESSPKKPPQQNQNFSPQKPPAQPIETEEKKQAAKTFAENWAKEPPADSKPKIKTIQDTLLEMANYVTPKTNTGPPCVTLGDEKSPKKPATGIPGLDLGRDSMQVKRPPPPDEEDPAPPGTDVPVGKPPVIKAEEKTSAPVAASNKPPGFAGNNFKSSPSPGLNSGSPNIEKANFPNQGPGFRQGNSGPQNFTQDGGRDFQGANQQGFGNLRNKQEQFENYDEYGDDSQDMAAMHERFAHEDESQRFSGPNNNFRGPDGPNENFRGPGGPNNNFRGPGGPNNNFRGPGGPQDNYQGPGGPQDNFRGPQDSFRSPAGPNDNFRGPAGANENFRGPENNFRDDVPPGPNQQQRPSEPTGCLPNDFNPWIDLGSDDELPPELLDRPQMPGRGDASNWDGPRGRPDQWPERPGFQDDGGKPPFREDPGMPRFNMGRQDNFDNRDMGRNDRGDIRGPMRDFMDDRGFGPDRGGPGGWGPEREWAMRPRVRPEWEDEEEYKAKTVIEYDHKVLNVVTPALMPANVAPAEKKKVIFKEPQKVFDYSHTSDTEPSLVTPDSFDYDPNKYTRWEEEDDRRRREEDRDRERWMQQQQERRNFQRQQRDWNRKDRNTRDRDDFRQNNRDRDDFQDKDRERDDFRDRDRERDDFRDRDRDVRDRDRNDFRDRDRDARDRPDSREESKDSRNKRSNSPKSGPSHSKNRGADRGLRDNVDPPAAQQQNKGQQQGNRLFNIPIEVDTTQIEDLLCLPGRVQRPSKFAIFMRGAPGSGKSFAAKLIKDKEVENGGNAPRILSLDDYFMTEVETEVQDPDTGRKIKSKGMKYEYEPEMEEPYRTSLIKAFKKTVDEGYFPIIIVDCVHDKLSQFEEMRMFAQSKGVKCFVVEMQEEAQTCASRNEHGRTLQDIEKILKNWEPSPTNLTRLDMTSLLQKASINEVEMEDMSQDEAEDDEAGVEMPFSALVELPSSKWDKLDTEDKLAKLDGIKKSNKSRENLSMDDWLGLEEQNDAPLEPGKKRVRWADIVERKEQEKMRAIGFVVGQTDWNRMMDPTFGGGALTRTKYI